MESIALLSPNQSRVSAYRERAAEKGEAGRGGEGRGETWSQRPAWRLTRRRPVVPAAERERAMRYGVWLCARVWILDGSCSCVDKSTQGQKGNCRLQIRLD